MYVKDAVLQDKSFVAKANTVMSELIKGIDASHHPLTDKGA